MCDTRIDIVIIGRNEERFLGRCLESVQAAAERLAEKCGVNSRVVFVDSQSTDDSVAVASAGGAEVFHAPTAFRTPANGRMAGLMLTRAEFIMFLDGDMELHREFLAAAMAFMRTRPEAAGVRGIWNDLQFRGRRQALLRNFDRIPDVITSKNAYFAGAFFARRNAIERVGGYDVGLLINEEVSLYCKLRAAGWITYRMPVPMITHLNAKISSPAKALTHLLVGSKPLMAGVLVRHALIRTCWWPSLLRYHRAKFFHGAVVGILVALAWTAWKMEPWRLGLSVPMLIVLTVHIVTLVREKGSWARGVAALFLRTVYFCNICFGFLFYFPRVSFGIQETDEYRDMVLRANPGCTGRGGGDSDAECGRDQALKSP